ECGITRSGIDAAPLNWRRGVFRLWVLASVAWIMVWAIYLVLSALAQALNTEGDFLAIPVVFFGPPIAVLLCGLATKWARVSRLALDNSVAMSFRFTGMMTRRV